MQWKMMGKQSRGGKMPENRKLFFTCVEIFSLFFYYFKFILISIHDYWTFNENLKVFHIKWGRKNKFENQVLVMVIFRTIGRWFFFVYMFYSVLRIKKYKICVFFFWWKLVLPVIIWNRFSFPFLFFFLPIQCAPVFYINNILYISRWAKFKTQHLLRKLKKTTHPTYLQKNKKSL